MRSESDDGKKPNRRPPPLSLLSPVLTDLLSRRKIIKITHKQTHTHIHQTHTHQARTHTPNKHTHTKRITHTHRTHSHAAGRRGYKMPRGQERIKWKTLNLWARTYRGLEIRKRRRISLYPTPLSLPPSVSLSLSLSLDALYKPNVRPRFLYLSSQKVLSCETLSPFRFCCQIGVGES